MTATCLVFEVSQYKSFYESHTDPELFARTVCSRLTAAADKYYGYKWGIKYSLKYNKIVKVSRKGLIQVTTR